MQDSNDVLDLSWLTQEADFARQKAGVHFCKQACKDKDSIVEFVHFQMNFFNDYLDNEIEIHKKDKNNPAELALIKAKEKLRDSFEGSTIGEMLETKKQSLLKDTPLHTRIENNYLRLIMQLANNIQGFNPKKPHEAAALIVKNTDIKLNEKTIAGYIQKAYELESKERA